MSQKMEAQGGNGGGVWNDGVNEAVKKVILGRDDYYITFVKFEYVKGKGTRVESHEHGHDWNHYTQQEFVVNYPDEYITSVEATYAQPVSFHGITSLVFKTSLGRTSQAFGNQTFVLANNGQKLVGFHGRSGFAIDALGANFVSQSSVHTKIEARGGEGGGTWDDGIHHNIRKIYIGGYRGCVTRLMVDYVNSGVPDTRAHGIANGDLQEFLLDTNEHITSVEGTYGKVGRFGSAVITSLTFRTSKGRTSPTFGATKFVLENNGRRLVGFHGRSGAVIDALGAHFALT